MKEKKAEIAIARAQLNKREALIADEVVYKEREHEAAAGAVLEEAIDSLGQSLTQPTDAGIDSLSPGKIP